MRSAAAVDVDYPADPLSIAVAVVASSRFAGLLYGHTEVEVGWSHHPAGRLGAAVLYGDATVSLRHTSLLGRAREGSVAS